MGRDADRNEPLAQATRWLARREYSVHELERRLRDKGYPARDVADVLADLESRGLVSDRRFAESMARSRVERGYGPVKIAHELRSKGIDDALIEAVVEQDGDYWVARLQAFWEKRYGRRPVDYQEWARQARGLQSRGFTADQVRRVVPDIDS